MSEFTSIASIGAAFAAGVLSFLSPCVMPLMPAYLSLISGISVEEMRDGCGDEGLRRRILLACLGFCTGFTTVFVLLGASAFAMGALVRTWRAEIFGIEFGMAQIAGLVVVVLGLHMAGLLPIRALYRDRHIDVTVQRVSWLRTFVVGAAFAFAWSPCVGPILGGIYTIAASRDTVFQGMALLAVYSAGLALPFMLTGFSIEWFFQWFHRVRRHFRKLELASGSLLVVIGLMLFFNQFTALNGYFAFLERFIAAAEEALL
jgi:cytochrome c-type biogenesis protein